MRNTCAKDSRISRLSQVVAEYPMVGFVAIAYGFSWLLFLPMIVAGKVVVPLIVGATFGPFLAAVILHRLESGSYRAVRLISSWPRAIFGAMTSIAVVVLAYVILPALVIADPRQLNWEALVSLHVYNSSTLLGGPIGEEPGWRGYALPRLEKRFGPALGTLLLSAIWSGWHLPLFLVPGWTSSPIWVYVLMQCGLSFIMTFGFNLAGFGLVAAIGAHAAFNTVSKLLGGLMEGATMRSSMSMETLLACCGLVVATLLLAATKGRLAYRENMGLESDGSKRKK